ncbi:MAG: family 14 glycosylhydrolase [Armatimonadetes bacterium]|nr:family 14 glycosylhydrolase [Armatimonadota bacterium]
MRLATIALFCLAISPALAKTVSVDLGPTNRESGLSVPSAGDGANEPAEVAGRPCRKVASDKSGYLYVQVADDAFHAGDFTVYLTCDVFDDGPRLLTAEYDSVAAEPTLATKYQRGPGLVLLGTGKWVRRTVKIEHARFGNGQNHGSDLRLAGTCAVARIELGDEAPAGFDPDRPVPAAELTANQVKIGKGMELTFGNDADANAALLFRAFGVTSVESYVTWQSVEDAGKGQWDWSRWDRQVAVLKQAGLKWVPFLIAGCAYATPKWFREGPQHHPYVCLDHGKPSKVESLWNPALKPEIDRFLAAFAERYRDSGVIEGVLLGVTGIYGESIYPAGPEGGWTADLPGPYRNHGGWWAGDALAVADFRARLRKQYASLDKLNTAWGTKLANWEAVTTFLPDKAPNATAREDFVRGYEETMTEWSRWWVEGTRKHFPKTEIYLCTGGDGAPYLGADFTAQAKAIAPYGAGIRITNEGSDYAANFAVTREVATATRWYGTFCGFEPAGTVDEKGVVARVYNATASGARQLHYYSPNVLDSPEAAGNFRRAAPFLQRRQPPPPRVAVYLPRAAWAQDPQAVGETYRIVRSLRELCDLDLVNRTSVVDGVLKSCRLLVLPTGDFLEPDAKAVIGRWVSAGGILARFEDLPIAGLSQPTVHGEAPAHWRLLVGAAGDEPFLFGDWNGPEMGREFPDPTVRKRWSGAAPGVYVPVVSGQPVSLEVEVVTPGHALAGATGEIRLDGQVLGKLRPGHAVYKLEVAGDRLRKPVAKLTVAVTGWRPSEKEGTTDTRLLGIAVTRVEAIRAGATGEAVVNQGLTVAIDRSKLPVERRGRGALVQLPRNAGSAEQPLLQALLGPLARELGAPNLADDEAFDHVFATRLGQGRLWLNMTDQPVERAGVRIEAFGIGLGGP